MSGLAPATLDFYLKRVRGYVPVGSFQDDALAEAVPLFNDDFQEHAAFIAGSHKYALDYIRAAPVIVPAMTNGRKLRLISERRWLAHTAIQLFSSGPKLRIVLD